MSNVPSILGANVWLWRLDPSGFFSLVPLSLAFLVPPRLWWHAGSGLTCYNRECDSTTTPCPGRTAQFSAQIRLCQHFLFHEVSGISLWYQRNQLPSTNLHTVANQCLSMALSKCCRTLSEPPPHEGNPSHQWHVHGRPSLLTNCLWRSEPTGRPPILVCSAEDLPLPERLDVLQGPTPT